MRALPVGEPLRRPDLPADGPVGPAASSRGRRHLGGQDTCVVQVVQPSVLVRPRGAAEQRPAVRARARCVPGVGLQHGSGGALDGMEQLPLEVPLDPRLAAAAAPRLAESLVAPGEPSAEPGRAEREHQPARQPGLRQQQPPFLVRRHLSEFSVPGHEPSVARLRVGPHRSRPLHADVPRVELLLVDELGQQRTQQHRAGQPGRAHGQVQGQPLAGLQDGQRVVALRAGRVQGPLGIGGVQRPAGGEQQVSSPVPLHVQQVPGRDRDTGQVGCPPPGPVRRLSRPEHPAGR